MQPRLKGHRSIFHNNARSTQCFAQRLEYAFDPYGRAIKSDVSIHFKLNPKPQRADFSAFQIAS